MVRLCIAPPAPLLLVFLFSAGCGHTHTCTIGLISFGDLAGKTIPADVQGPILEGRDMIRIRIGQPPASSLSNAARDALKNTDFDTLVDVEVTAQTGFYGPSNGIIVRGKAINSRTLGAPGGTR